MATFQRSGSFTKVAESGGSCSGAIPRGPGEESVSDVLKPGVLNPGYGPVGEAVGAGGDGTAPGTPDGFFVGAISPVTDSKAMSFVSGPLIERPVRSMVWNPSFSALSSYDAGASSTNRKMPSASVRFSLTTMPARSRLIFAPGIPRLVRESLTVPCSDAVLVGRCPGMRCACPDTRFIQAINARSATGVIHALPANDALARLVCILRNGFSIWNRSGHNSYHNLCRAASICLTSSRAWA